MSEEKHIHLNTRFCHKIIISVETEQRLGGGKPETNSIHFLTYNNLNILQLKILSEQSLMLSQPSHRSVMANARFCLHMCISSCLTLVQQCLQSFFFADHCSCEKSFCWYVCFWFFFLWNDFADGIQNYDMKPGQSDLKLGSLHYFPKNISSGKAYNTMPRYQRSRWRLIKVFRELSANRAKAVSPRNAYSLQCIYSGTS